MKNTEIKEIIVHCTATPAGREVSVAQIDAWHKQRGFSGIGYHYVVHLDGEVHAGRMPSEVGAHCLGHNVGSLGVCYVGGLTRDGKPADTRTDAQRKALVNLLTRLLRMHPGAVIRSHRDFAAKACPCFDATAEYSSLKADK